MVGAHFLAISQTKACQPASNEPPHHPQTPSSTPSSTSSSPSSSLSSSPSSSTSSSPWSPSSSHSSLHPYLNLFFPYSSHYSLSSAQCTLLKVGQHSALTESAIGCAVLDKLILRLAVKKKFEEIFPKRRTPLPLGISTIFYRFFLIKVEFFWVILRRFKGVLGIWLG